MKTGVSTDIPTRIETYNSQTSLWWFYVYYIILPQ